MIKIAFFDTKDYDKKFFNDFKFHALTPEDLFKKWYINYIIFFDKSPSWQMALVNTLNVIF